MDISVKVYTHVVSMRTHACVSACVRVCFLLMNVYKRPYNHNVCVCVRACVRARDSGSTAVRGWRLSPGVCSDNNGATAADKRLP